MFWWTHCWPAAKKATSTKPTEQSRGWRPAADEAPLLREVWLLRLRALVARARGGEVGYRELAQRYRALATSLGFEGHMAMAEAMTSTARKRQAAELASSPKICGAGHG